MNQQSSEQQLKQLWIMRHGLAVDEFDTDFNRALSNTGRVQALQVCRQILATGEKPSLLMVSPFRRTQETAQVVQKNLGIVSPFITEEMLVHFGNHQILGDFLLAAEHDNLMIVSHMPIVAKLTQYLVPGCDIFGFQTAQVVKIEWDSSNKASIAQVFLPNT